MSQVACRNFKMSCVGVLSRLHNTVGNLATYICLRQSFFAILFERCRYFLAHVACRNLPWQGLVIVSSVPPLVIASNFALASTNSPAIQVYYEIAVFSGFFCGIAVFADIFCGNAVFSNPQCPPQCSFKPLT